MNVSSERSGKIIHRTEQLPFQSAPSFELFRLQREKKETKVNNANFVVK